jgi:hypothetical protein
MKIWSVALIGFLFGVLSAVSVHPTIAAHAATNLHVHVFEVSKGGDVELTPAQGTQL